MKKLLLILAFCPIFVLAQVSTKGFTIEGKVDGHPDGTDVVIYKNGENTEMARTKLDKSKFEFKGSVNEPVLCFIIIGNSKKPIEVFVENTKISIKGNDANPPVFEIEGSSSHKDFEAFLKDFMPHANQLNSLASTINATPAGTEREKLTTVYNTTMGNLQKSIDKFIKDKPKSWVSPFVLNVTYSYNDDIAMLESRYKLLDDKIKKTETGKQLELFIADGKIGAIGTQAMDFSQPDTSGTPVSLSSFRGQYVLIDFWASWCGPCRTENPNVVENFNKFKKKNFTILGVSLDRPGQKEKWVNAIHEDNLTWTHISDLQFWSNSAALLYKVKGIPQNFLVDPQGKIVAKNLRGPQLEAKLCELLGCETKPF